MATDEFTTNEAELDEESEFELLATTETEKFVPGGIFEMTQDVDAVVHVAFAIGVFPAYAVAV